MKKACIWLISILLTSTFACKKETPPPDPKTIIVGKWLGKIGVDANSLYDSTELNVSPDFSFTNIQYKNSTSIIVNLAKGNLTISNNTASGPFEFTQGLAGKGFIRLNFSNDYKKLTGGISATENGPLIFYMDVSK